MPPTPVVTMSVDVEARRLQTDRLVQLIDGTQWDTYASTSNGFIEPITKTAMLLPLPFSPAWLTTISGNYSRLSKSQLSIASSTDWLEFSRPPLNGNLYMHGLGAGSNANVYTHDAWQKNRPMWLSWFAYNSGGEAFVQMECGWGEGTTSDVRLRFWSSGEVDVFKNGAQVGSGSITDNIAYPSGLSSQSRATGSNGNVTANELVEVALIPCRQRELLILSASTGGGFNHEFTDISPDDSSPTITGAGQFWFKVPVGQATVQVCPLKFAPDATLLGRAFDFRAAPNNAAVFTGSPYHNTAGYGAQTVTLLLKDSGGIADFVANGTNKRARIRVDMVGDGDSTPFVYGAGVAFDASTALTPNTPTALGNYWMRAEWEVPDDPSGVSLRVDLMNPAAIEAAGAFALRTIGNRPISVLLGSYQIFSGRTMEPDADIAPSDETEVLLLDCRDGWAKIEKTLISDPEPFDGMYLHTAIQRLLHIAGFVAGDWEIETVDYQLPSVPAASKGEWSLLPEVGDTVAQWIQRLHEEFARKFFYGFTPTLTGVKFYFVSPEFLTNTANATVYLSNDDQPVPGGETLAQQRNRYRLWATAFKERVAPPEANDIYVVGRDPRTELPIVHHYRDTASANATTAVASRPANWIGELRQYAWVDPALTTDGDVAWVLSTLIDVVTPVRRFAEWECQMLIGNSGLPIWRGDVVRVQSKGLYRVKSFRGTFDLEKADAGSNTLLDSIDRRFTYTGEWIGA